MMYKEKVKQKLLEKLYNVLEDFRGTDCDKVKKLAEAYGAITKEDVTIRVIRESKFEEK